MSTVNTTSNCNTPVDLGASLQAQMLPADIGLAASIAASGSAVSNTVINNGYKSIAFATKSTQAGNISIQRYLDQAGTIPQGAALTGSISANTDTVVNNADGHPFQSMIITVTNSGGSTATLTNTFLLLQAS